MESDDRIRLIDNLFYFLGSLDKNVYQYFPVFNVISFAFTLNLVTEATELLSKNIIFLTFAVDNNTLNINLNMKTSKLVF